MLVYIKFFLLFLLLVTEFSCKSNKNTSNSNQQKGSPIVIDSTFNTENKNMRMNILNMQLNKDILTIEINYSGGCKEHQFNLYSNGIAENNTLQLFLVDAQTEDFCKMLITDTLNYNLSNLKTLTKSKLNITINRNEEILQYP